MSWSAILSKLETVGKDVLAGTNAAAPLLNIFVPGAGAALQGVTALIMQAEAKFPAAGAGADKKAWVMDVIQLGLPILENLLASKGYTLKLDPQALSTLIDATVAEFNAIEAFHKSFTLQANAKPA